MLSVRDLSLSFGKHILLDHIDFDLAPGRIHGLVAPNGHGKTTLLRAMAGLPGARVAGSVDVDGLPSRAQAARRRRVFYAPGEGSLLYPGMTAADHLNMVRDLWRPDRTVAQVAELVRIEGFMGKRVRSLSQGMKQQLTLAIAYLTGARYLLLDEPMNALDPTNVQVNSAILRDLAAEGAAVIMSSHILDNVDQVSDTIIFVKDARLLEYVPGGEGDAEVPSADSAPAGRHFAPRAARQLAFRAEPHFAAPDAAPGSHAPVALPRIGNPGERAIDIYRRLYLDTGFRTRA